MKAHRLLYLFGIFWFFGCATQPEKVTSGSERARLLVEIANGALMEGDPTTALKYLDKAHQEDSSLPELHHTRSLAYYSKNRLEESIESAKQAVTLHPGYAQANNTLGRLLLEKGSYKQAEPYLMKAAMDPLYGEAYKARTNLGITYYRQKQFSKSYGEFKRAIRDEKNLSCVARYYMGHLSVRQKKNDKALKFYQSATRDYCGGFSDAHYALGVTYERNKDFEEARRKYIEVRELFPGSRVAKKASQRLKKLP